MFVIKKKSFTIIIFFCIYLVTIKISLNATEVIQPIGKLIQLWSAAAVNTNLATYDTSIIPGVTDPFDANTQINSGTPTSSFTLREANPIPQAGLGGLIFNH